MPYKAYAGHGNRDTPPDILAQMTQLAKQLSDLGYVLRINGSDIPGNAFEAGATKVEHYLPWKSFKKSSPTLYTKPTEDAFEVAKRYHPVFDQLDDKIKLLIACTSHVILGANVRDPVAFLICWSPDGAEQVKDCTVRTGIVNQAIKIAASQGIPVFNLKNPNATERLNAFLTQHP